MATRSLRTFYLLILTQTLSIIGSNMTSFAVGIQIYRDTSEATPLAMVGFFSVIPMILAAGAAGVLADRWDRRYVMAISDSGQALGTLLLLISFASGAFRLWHLYIITLLQSTFYIFQRPAFSASITMLIPDKHRDRANAIQQITGPTGRLIAPIFAGFLYALVGLAGVLLIDLATFVLAIVVVLAVQIPRPKRTEEAQTLEGNRWQQATIGLRYLISKKPIFLLVLYTTIPNFLVNGALILNTPYLLSLNNSEKLLGILTAALGAGNVVGGLIMGVWGGTRPRIHTILPSNVLLALFLAIYGLVRTPLSLGIVLFLTLFWLPFANAAYMSILQIKIPADLQGRVMAALLQVSLIITPLAYLVYGPLADRVFEPAVGGSWWHWVEPIVGGNPGSGMGLMIFASGILMIIAGIVAYILPSIRNLEASLPNYVAEAEGMHSA